MGKSCKTDKADDCHDYLTQYDWLFSPMRQKQITLLEIGVQNGHSIEMWLQYFERGQIIGVDIDDCPSPKHERYTFIRGDQSNPSFWIDALGQMKGSAIDIVIDDGGHKPDGIITTFRMLWPHVSMGGFYTIEDLYCAYRPSYQVEGWQNQMDFVKGLLDEINNRRANIMQLMFSNELAVIQKQQSLDKRPPPS